MKTVCIDFGTSSMRAAVRDGSRITPLAIAPGSPIDNASIPSAIYIPNSGSEVCFGIEALDRGESRDDALLFELSPKSWLSPGEIYKIDERAVSGLSFTRRDLIRALLSMTLEATLKAAQIPYERSAQFELRISHPAWDEGNRKLLSAEYESLRRFILMRRSPQVRPVMSSADFMSWCGVVEDGDLQVEEPVATALSVYEDVERNARSVLLAVDIGAGTIDLGFFASVVPDVDARVRRRLLPLVSPVSIFGAGDEIDRELLSVFMNSRRITDVQKVRARNRIRSIKERLFTNGRVSYEGVIVDSKDLISRPSLIKMARKLQEKVSELINSGAKEIGDLSKSSIHRLNRIHVVMAGGGAGLDFLARAVERGVSESDLRLELRLHVAKTPERFAVEASMARMAVALGGVVDAKDWPLTTWSQATVRKGLSSIRKI